LLARVMRPTTNSLLERLGICAGKACLDVGCGGGDVSFDLSRMVGPDGRVVATDIDPVKIEMAGEEATRQGLANIEFRLEDIRLAATGPEFDVVYARFLLTHLPDPGLAIRHMQTRLRAGGMIVVEDIDFAGSFCFPPCEAFDTYCRLYTETVRRRGGDPNIGSRLPALLLEAGFAGIQMNIFQPSPLAEEVKQISAVTMENIAEAVIAEGLATSEEIGRIAEELHRCARDRAMVVSTPRLVQTWGVAV
jgi:SAM-dependent methyltransferase